MPACGSFAAEARVHTHSSVMCWAACDRLARIAEPSRLAERATHWQRRAPTGSARPCCGRRGTTSSGSFVAIVRRRRTSTPSAADARGRLHPAGAIRASSARSTAVERELRARPASLPLHQSRRFRRPDACFIVCYLLVHRRADRAGTATEARELFENMLACRNHLGLLSEDIDPETSELWGNFPQTYSHGGADQLRDALEPRLGGRRLRRRRLRK